MYACAKFVTSPAVVRIHPGRQMPLSSGVELQQYFSGVLQLSSRENKWKWVVHNRMHLNVFGRSLLK